MAWIADCSGVRYTEAEIARLCRSRLEEFLDSNPKAKARWEGSTEGLTDTSGSAMDFSIAAMLKGAGFSRDELEEILADWPHGSEGGKQQQGARYFGRLWNRCGRGTDDSDRPRETAYGGSYSGETATGTDDLDPDVYQAPPSLDPKMLYGIAGDFAKHAALKSEVNRVAAAANVLAMVACNAGRATYQYIGDTVHYAALYTMHVGRTSIGGKGDALSLVDRVVMRIEDLIRQGGSHKGGRIPQDLLCNNHSGGLSSGEGLIMLIHDGIGTLEKGEVVKPPRRSWISGYSSPKPSFPIFCTRPSGPETLLPAGSETALTVSR